MYDLQKTCVIETTWQTNNTTKTSWQTNNITYRQQRQHDKKQNNTTLRTSKVGFLSFFFKWSVKFFIFYVFQRYYKVQFFFVICQFCGLTFVEKLSKLNIIITYTEHGIKQSIAQKKT